MLGSEYWARQNQRSSTTTAQRRSAGVELLRNIKLFRYIYFLTIDCPMTRAMSSQMIKVSPWDIS